MSREKIFEVPCFIQNFFRFTHLSCPVILPGSKSFWYFLFDKIPNIVTTTETLKSAVIVQPGEFEVHHHWYPKALNATIHPMISFFLNLEQERIVSRYCHMHPTVNADKLRDILNYNSKYFL